MRILLSGGIKTQNIVSGIDKKFKASGDDFLVIEYMDDQDGLSTVGETRRHLESNLGRLETIANGVIAAEGYDYDAKADLGIRYIPEKTYGDMTFPAGNYEALNITIGDGENDIETFTQGEVSVLWMGLYLTAIEAVMSHPNADGHAYIASEAIAVIEEIGGLDKTNGACTSLALCWAAARHGANIRDFRGDYGTSWFCQDPNIRMLASIPGIDCEIKVSQDSLGVAQRFLKTMQPDKEYILSVARHTAVVRHNSATDQDEYLELQGIRQVNKFWPLTERVLRNRFGASENQPVACDNFFFDLDSVGSNSDMMILMEYINTKPEDQMKGAGGGIK